MFQNEYVMKTIDCAVNLCKFFCIIKLKEVILKLIVNFFTLAKAWWSYNVVWSQRGLGFVVFQRAKASNTIFDIPPTSFLIFWFQTHPPFKVNDLVKYQVIFWNITRYFEISSQVKYHPKRPCLNPLVRILYKAFHNKNISKYHLISDRQGGRGGKMREGCWRQMAIGWRRWNLSNHSWGKWERNELSRSPRAEAVIQHDKEFC